VVEKKIGEFNEDEKIQGFFLVKSVAVKTAANNNKYIDFTLADQTGEINAKLWDYHDGDEEKYTDCMLVKVRGVVTSWQSKLQLRIEKIRNVTEEDNIRLEDYVPSAPCQPKEMLAVILKYIIQMKNQDIKEIVSAIVNQKRDKLLHYPAAQKNHHAVRGGLLYHTMTMLMAAEKLCEVYTFLNRDLLYGGVILHDMAKIDEMDANELGIVEEYSVEGMLLGHIVQGVNMVGKVGEQLDADKEIVLLLQHMILSHHYEPEFGSPKRPMIPEAEMLHYLDIIDARMYDMKKALDGIEKGSFSERLWLLHNRQIYKFRFDESDDEQAKEGKEGFSSSI